MERSKILKNRKIKINSKKKEVSSRTNPTNYDSYIYDKLKEAEMEIHNTNLRYNTNEVRKALNDIIDN